MTTAAPKGPAAALLFAALLAPAAAAQGPGNAGPQDAPRLEYHAAWDRPADAETVARARTALEPLTGQIPGLAVADATAVDPLTIRLTDDHPGTLNRVRRALREAGVTTGGLDGGSVGNADPAWLAAMLRHEIAEMESDVPLPRPLPPNLPPELQKMQEELRDRAERARTPAQRAARLESHRRRREAATDRSGPWMIWAMANGPLREAAAAARGALAGVDPGLNAAFAVEPTPDHRSLVVRYEGTRLDGTRIRLALLDAGVPLDGRSSARFLGDDAADPERTARIAAAAAENAAVGPRLLTLTYSPPPDGGDVPNLSGRVRQAADGAGVPGAKLLLADADGRTYVVGYEGDGADGWAIHETFRHLAMAEHEAAHERRSRAIRGGASLLTVGHVGGEFLGLAVSMRPEIGPVDGTGELSPPTKLARTVTLTLKTPVPGDRAANAAAVRNAARTAGGVYRPKVTGADWDAGRVVIEFVGYPWGGDRIAEAVRAAGADVTDHATSPAGRD